MNLKYISYFLVGSLMFLSLSSCDDLLDGFLTQENPNEVTTDVFWDNLSDCNKGLTAVYNSFKNQAIYQFCAENNRSDLTWPGVWPKYPQTSNVFICTLSMMPHPKSEPNGLHCILVFSGLIK